MVKVSIPNPGNGGGAPTIKNPSIILVSVSDIATEPARTVGNTNISGNYTLKEGAKGIAVYATPSSIELTEEVQGEADARGLLKGVNFNHPGTSVQISNLTESIMNEGVIAFVTECDGSAAGTVKVVGSKCNPLYNQPEYTNSSEGTRRRFSLKQEQADKFVIATYSGTLPEVEAESTSQESA